MGRPRELHKDLVPTGFAAPVVSVPITLDVTETADVTIVGFRAPRRMQLVSATYHQESAATAVTSYTVTLQNAAGPTSMTDALDIKALGADEGADFAGIPTGEDAVLEDGEHMDIVFNETGGTVTAPDRVTIFCEFLLLE